MECYRRARLWWTQLMCGVRTSHIDYPIYGYGHLSTRCMNCGHVRKGWTWDVKTVRRMTR